jgi:TDG/mug DNA glycosylase family protein
MSQIEKPTAEQLRRAVYKTIPDVIAPGLKVLFCGINPGLYSGATGHHFARPGNRFWPALFASGFTDRLLTPAEKDELLDDGYGITNIVARTTLAADELSKDELVAGAKILSRKVKRHRPKVVAFLGIGAYRAGFARPKAALGLQDETIGDSVLWVLPNPSGLNAHFTPKDLAVKFRDLKKAIDVMKT